MKAIKFIPKIIERLLELFVIVVVGLMLYSLIDKTDTFYIRDAEFNNPNFLHGLDERLKKEDPFEVLHKSPTVFMHRIKSGNGLIIGYRRFSNDSFAIDDEGFEKITVWLPILPQEVTHVYDLADSSKAIVAFTRGGSAWPKMACAGYLGNGKMKIVAKNDKYSVTINGNIKSEKYDALKDFCHSKSVSLDFSAKQITYSDLTPWFGIAGKHPYAETYR